MERISRLVSQLLSLARNEPNTVKKVDLAAVDLGKLALDTTMEWVPEAYRRKIDLGFEGDGEHVTIRATHPLERADRQPARQRNPL